MNDSGHFTRSTLPPHITHQTLWAQVDAEALPEKTRDRFYRMQRAISSYLEGERVKTIASNTGIYRADLLRVLNKCVMPHEDGRLNGWRSLIKGTHVKAYSRTAPVIASEKAGGMAGAFQQLLINYPGIREALDTVILKRKKPGVIHESLVTDHSLHGIFLHQLAIHKVPANVYPNNTERKAARSLSAYAKRVRESHFSAGAKLWGGKDAGTRARTNTGEQKFQLSVNPMDVCSADAHRLDFVGMVFVETPRGPQKLPISRLQLLPIIDGDSTAILGYTVVFSKECGARHLIDAIKNSLSIWQPRQSPLPGLKYPENAGMPSSLIPEMAGALPFAICADNARISYSAAYSMRARTRMGIALNWGPAGDWFVRDAIENIFAQLTQRGFQRLSNTTGTGSIDPRRTNPAQEALKHEYTWDEMLFVIDLVITTYNITGRKNLGYRSPIQYLIERLQHPASTFLPRKLPPLLIGQPDIGIVVEKKTVRGNIKNGRRPYVQIDNEKYTSPTLAGAAGLIGTQLIIHINEAEFQTVVAYLASGAELGPLKCLGPWGRIKHSRSIRREVNRQIASKNIHVQPGEEPIQAFLRAKGEQALVNRQKGKSARISPDATKMLAAALECDIPLPTVSMPLKVDGVVPTASPSPNSVSVPKPPRRGLSGGAK